MTKPTHKSTNEEEQEHMTRVTLEVGDTQTVINDPAAQGLKIIYFNLVYEAYGEKEARRILGMHRNSIHTYKTKHRERFVTI